jgi:transposase InsO family protein
MNNAGLAAHRFKRPALPALPYLPLARKTKILQAGPARLSCLDNGTAYTSRGFRARLRELGIAHRRGGYRDPESQAFIESWFSKLKEREVWRSEYETLDQARAAIAAYVERYHHRPHQFLGYRTPKEVRQTWEDAQETEALRNHAA